MNEAVINAAKALSLNMTLSEDNWELFVSPAKAVLSKISKGNTMDSNSAEIAMMRAEINNIKANFHIAKSLMINTFAEIRDHAEDQDYDAIIEICNSFEL